MKLKNIKPAKTFSSSSNKTKECFFSQNQANQRNLIVSNYSNPEQAIIRELTANARDAHIAANQTKPIELTIRNNKIGATFCIRDYGNGVSKEFLDTKWCEIGHSTKSNTNDQVGAFGIGRMTPFCLAESFSVTSFQNGKAYIYIMSENSNGVFQNTFMGTRQTSEPDGIKIEFNSNRGRFDSQHMSQIMFLDVPIKIELDGKELKTQKLTDFSWSGPDYALADMGEKTIIYGGIKYRDPFWNRYYYGNRSSKDAPFIINIPLGELEVSSSRESISNTAENKQAIEKYTKKACDHLSSSIQSKIDTCATRKEAFKMFFDLNHLFKNYKSYTYKGEVLSAKTINSYRSYSLSNNNVCYDNGIYPINLHCDIKVILLDSTKYAARNYIKAAELYGKVIVSKNTSVGSLAKEFWLDEQDIIKSSDLDDKTKAYLKEKRKNSNTDTSVSHAKYFNYNGNFASGWIKNQITPTKTPEKYLVMMDRYNLCDRQILMSYQSIGVPIPKFTVVRESVYKKLIATGKHEPLVDKAKQEIEAHAKTIIHHLKRQRIYNRYGKLFKFLHEECGWKRLGSIITKLHKSVKICNNKKNLVSLAVHLDNQDYCSSLDLGLVELISYSIPTNISDRQKEDLKALYKIKYGKVSK